MSSFRVFSRALSTTARMRNVSMKQSLEGAKGVFPNSPGYSRVQQLQKQFCEQDGRLVWQKGGVRDNTGYMATMAVAAGSTCYVAWILWTMSWPKKQD